MLSLWTTLFAFARLRRFPRRAHGATSTRVGWAQEKLRLTCIFSLFVVDAPSSEVLAGTGPGAGELQEGHDVPASPYHFTGRAHGEAPRYPWRRQPSAPTLRRA